MALRLWADDRDALSAQIAGLDDPVAQLAVVIAVSEAHPGETTALCAVLPDGPGKARCDRGNARPHLRAARQNRAPPSDAADVAVGTTQADQAALARPGPAQTVLLPSDPEGLGASPFDGLAASDVPCDDPLLANGCRTDAARTLAVAGQYAESAAACLGGTDGTWRWECFFEASEAAVDGSGAAALGGALDLCLASGEFVPNCLAHVAMGLGAHAPAATDGDPAAWDDVKAGVGTIRERIGPRDADLAARVVERVWSEALDVSYQRARRVVGNPLDVLPAEAVPHVHAALVWRLLELEGERATLDEWSTRLEEALAARIRGSARSEGRLRQRHVIGLWIEVYPGEEVFTPALLMGSARRVTAEDPLADAIICVLEVNARMPSPSMDLMLKALDYPDPAVRWTAARLIQVLDRPGRYRDQLLSHPDAVVRGRGERSFDVGGGR